MSLDPTSYLKDSCGHILIYRYSSSADINPCVRPSVVGQAEGIVFDEDELLGRLRGNGLITYPSPLLSFLEEYPDLVRDEVLPRLDSTDRAVLAQVGPPLMAAVVASDLPRAGKSAGMPLRLKEFCGSVGRLAWARVNGCPWEMLTCAIAAKGGHLEVLEWAREHGCEWDELTCADAAEGGHLEVLQWARQHGCPWQEDLWEPDLDCCYLAAANGHLEVLQWVRRHGCPWNQYTGTGMCCSGRGNRIPLACGMRRRAQAPLRKGTWRCCGGRGGRTLPARGTRRKSVDSPLRGVTWRC